MKLNELNFKCVLDSEEKRINIFNKFKSIGGASGDLKTMIDKPLIVIRYKTIKWVNTINYYNKLDAEQLTYKQAMRELDKIEQEQIQFDIKPFDKVLKRDSINKDWYCGYFSHTGDENFMIIADGLYKQVIKFEGNEELIGSNITPSEYWIVKNNKPFLVKSDD